MNSKKRNSKAGNHRAPACRMFSRALILLPVLALWGCSGGSDMQNLRQELQAIAERPGGEIEPIPRFRQYEAFTYSAASLRSPFDLPSVAREDGEAETPDNVEPDPDREREPLEEFALGNLEMVGMLTRGNETVALVRDETGQVHRVGEGNYMGRNHGQVEEVMADRIELTEIVPSGDGGWIERPRTVSLSN